VGFAPTAVSLLSKVSTVAFFSGSVAGALTARSLLIRRKNIAIRSSFQMVRKYCEEIRRDCAKYFALDRSNSLLPASKFSRALKLPEKA